MQKGGIYTEFNAKSAKYQELASILREHGEQLTWAKGGEGERVLDVGSGPGDVTVNVIRPSLPPNFAQLVGVDISPLMTTYSRATYIDDRLFFETLDIGTDISEFLEKYPERFDKILSFYVMNWVRDLEKGVNNLYSLLRPGGEALLMFPVNRHFQKTFKSVSLREPWSQYLKEKPRRISPYLHGEDPCGEFKDIVKSAGFEIISCNTHHKYDIFDSVSVLKELIESLDQFVSCIPLDQKEDYLNDCVKIMQESKAVKCEKEKVLMDVAKIIAVLKKPSL